MLIDLADVKKTYAAPDGGDSVPVLDGVNFTATTGDTVAFVGPSGCGKSTLLNIIGALDRADSGTVSVAGENLAALDDDGLARFRSETVGFVFQLHHLLPQCTVLENVLVPTLARPSRENGVEARAEELLDAVGLRHRLHHRPGLLSGGERQRAAVARALINRPKVLLADEPTGALDRVNASRLVDLLIQVNRDQGVPIIMVTHAMDLARRMNRVFELVDGRLCEARG